MSRQGGSNTMIRPPITFGPPSYEAHSPTTASTQVATLRYEDRKVLVPHPATFQIAVELAKKHIAPNATVVRFLALVPGEDEEVEITDDVWSLVASSIKTFRVVVVNQVCRSDKRALRVLLPSPYPSIVGHPQNNKGRPQRAAGSNGRTLFLKTLTGKTITIAADTQYTIEMLKSIVQDKEGIPPEQQTLVYAGNVLEDGLSLSSYSIPDEAVIHLTLSLRGGKPVIYLYPPKATDVTVHLTLVSEWRFSAIYPLSPVLPLKPGLHPYNGQCVTWNVHAQENGTIRDKLTDVEVSYIFWEAETHSAEPMTPPLSRQATPSLQESTVEAFIPGKSRCCPSDSVLLPTETVPYYLDQALLALGLHIEARTSFITYWLPSVLKHSHVALRFLPQASYECAAPLDINPRPDVVTRVFMLFQGVLIEGSDAWSEAKERAKLSPSIWKGVVGLNEIGQRDPSLFRVLEWGGMEIV